MMDDGGQPHGGGSLLRLNYGSRQSVDWHPTPSAAEA
jgi:hypothetical protein